VNPIFLYQFQDRVLFEAEFEFELSEGVTQTGLEYGQVDFTVNDHLIVSGGKMLVPFGIFARGSIPRGSICSLRTHRSSATRRPSSASRSRRSWPTSASWPGA
jgi:hypothetical protein